ncbi:MAG: DNA gyrase subunit A [Candidatus Woesearchaeota archaeon]
MEEDKEPEREDKSRESEDNPSEREEKKADNSPEGRKQEPSENIPGSSESADKPAGGRVTKRVIEDEMKEAYLDYSMSVIVGRALPDVKDGMKPVHRRIIYAMHDMGLVHNKPSKKSARIVGEVLGKYHPHGDSAVYDALVRMAQEFSMRYRLINGQGNFGSIDGDSAAAMRYTEAKLTKISEDIIKDIDKGTVDFMPNFDGSLKEPVVLPAKVPNLLVNGSSGIAVGMATNIPPHNLREISEGAIALIENPDMSIAELMDMVKGPDFPTAGIISGMNGIKSAYTTGRGRIVVKARADIEEHKNRERIVITEIPYQINKALLIEEIANHVKEKKITGISDIRDESDKSGIRVVIELRKDAQSNVVLNQLYKYTRMTYTFGAIMLALVDNQPKLLNLKQLLQHHISHRQVVVRRRTEFELKKARERSHILEGLIIALDNIDEVITGIKKSGSIEEAKSLLMKDYSLSEAQAKAILEMRLQKLSSMEQNKIREEQKELTKLIERLTAILASEQEILAIIKKEFEEVRDEYGDERRTVIEESQEDDMVMEDLIREEDVVVTISHKGYIKRTRLSEYKQQQRGGKGVIAAGTKDEDFVERMFITSTHSNILFFTDRGKVYWLKVYNIPEASRQARGKAIVNMINIARDEKVYASVDVKEFDDKHYLVLATEKGIIKKTNLKEYSRPRQTGIIGITLEEGDNLVNAVLTDGSKQVMLATSGGMAIKFHEKDARPIGRTSKGVRGISLKGDDRVIGMVLADESKTLFTVTENGYGKRTKISDYRLINRGGVGVRNIQCTGRNGRAVAVRVVDDEDQIMLMSRKGITIRCPVNGIPAIGRNTQGVRIMKISPDDSVAGAADIVQD